MKNYIIRMSLMILLGSCVNKSKEVKFIPLNPPFEEFIPTDSPFLDNVFKGKLCRSDYFIVDGFVGRNKSFD